MSDRNYGAIRDVETLGKFVTRCITSGKPIGFDIEAGYIGPDRADTALQQYHPDWLFTGFSFTVSTEWARYVPVHHDTGGNVDDVVEAARWLWRLLMSGKIVAHNAPYEITGCSRFVREVLWNDPILKDEIRETNGLFPILDDTMVAVWLSAEYDPLRVGKDLKSVAKSAFGLIMSHFGDLFPAEDSELGPKLPKAKKRFARFNTRNSYAQPVIDYACEDAVAALMVHEKHYEKMYINDKVLKDSFVFKFEHGLQPVLHEMERGPVDPETGYAQGNLVLDWDLIHQTAAECARFRDQMNEEILSIFSKRLGTTITANLASVPQLRKLLYDPAPAGLGLPIADKYRSDKTDEPSTSDDALRGLAKEDPLIRKILDYRQVVKLYGSYLHKYETDLDYAANGVVFPNHNQAGALTGRMSVDHFSYQQLPKPYHYELDDGTSFDFNFRNVIVSPNDHRIIGFDFSQIELRVLAGQAQETAMLKAFADGIDIHKATAASMLRLPLEEITKKQRAVGKTCNFAVVYGSGPGNIADMLTGEGTPTTTEQAEKMLELYYAGFPRLRDWMDRKVADGHEQGWVETMFGRKFTVWEFQSPLPYIKKKGDRMCVNAPIQGGAADYLKIGMVRVYKAIKEAEASGLIPKNSVRLFMTVHDALEFYVRNDVSTQTVIDLVNSQVTFAVKGLPDIRADWHEGTKWGDVVEIKLDDQKQINGYEWEDPDGEKHDFDTLPEAYAFQEQWVSSKAAKGIAEMEVLLAAEPEPVKDTLLDLFERFEVEPEMRGLILDACEKDADTPEEEVKIEADRIGGWDLIFKLATEMSERVDPIIDARNAERGFTDDAVADTKERAKPIGGDEMKARLEADTAAARARKAAGPKDVDDPPWAASKEFMASIAKPEKVAVLTLEAQPLPDNFQAFLDWAAEHPGDTTVKLEMPEGELALDEKVSIDPTDQGLLSLILGGASLTFLTEAVDLDLTEGILL